MTLAEIEYQAARISEGDYPLHDQEAVDLARFILRALPLIRAAEEWRDTEGHDLDAWLAERIDAFRGGDK